MARTAAARSERGAVAAMEINGALYLWRYAPRTLDATELDALFTRAAGKLGWRRDRRTRNGWHKTCRVEMPNTV